MQYCSILNRGLRSFVLFILVMLASQWVKAQNRYELGMFVGAGYYNGDLNPGTPFVNVHPAFGGLFRYNMTDRIAWKATATLTELSGGYPAKGVLFPHQQPAYYSFARTIGDASVQMELNFLSYDHPYITKTKFTPYITYGVATTIYKRYGDQLQNEENKTVFVLSLPFGVGAKYKINNWIRIGAEWTMRKTFVDDLDYVGHQGLIDPSDPYAFGYSAKTHGNDWYSFAGVTVSFSFSRRKTECNSGY